MANETIQDLLDRVADGNGYGDPDARANDGRKLQVLLAQEVRESICQVRAEMAANSASSSKLAGRLNLLTLLLVVVGLLNVAVLVVQLPQRARPDAGTQYQPGDFVLSGVAVLALAAFCALWARSTGRDPWLWLAAGLVFNVFALLAVWAKHEGDKKAAKAADSGGSFERPREGGASSQNVRPA